MKRNRLLTFIVSALCLVLLAVLPATAQTEGGISADEKCVVSLLQGEENAVTNFKALRAALEKADGEHTLTVQIEQAGVYYISSGSLSSGKMNARGLRLHSDTVFDLNGSTLIRSGGVRNLLQVTDLDDVADSVGGYALAKNITVCNGTLDGAGGYQGMSVLVTAGHTENLRLLDLHFLNGIGSHLVELSGCKDCVIKNCLFSGFTDTGSTSEPGEAVQLEICHKTANGSWNGVYVEDNTVCTNITVEGCTFKDYPSGVGNHHTLTGGAHNSGIVIKNNRFLNTLPATAAAIWCFGFDDSVVSGNTVTGNYTCAVHVSAGNVDVKGNKIGTKEKPFKNTPVMITKASANRLDGKDGRVTQTVTGGTVSSNTIYTSCSADSAISVFSGSRLSSVSSNTVVDSSAKSNAIRISGSTVTKISANTVKAPKEWGLYVTGSTVKKISGNTVTAKSGINFSSSSKGTELSSNTVTASGGKGIYLTKSGTTSLKITGNTVTAKADSGIYLTGSKAASITKNTVKSPKKYGIALVSSSSVKSVSSNTVTSAGSDSLYVSGSTVTNILSNTIKSGKARGIAVTSSGKVSAIRSNKVTSCKSTGITVLNSSIKKITVTDNILKKNKTPLMVKAKGKIQKK